MKLFIFSVECLGLEEWIKLQIILHRILKHGLLNILCDLHGDPNIEGLPTVPEKLYRELNETYIDLINEKVQQHSINDDEFSLLFPENKKTVLEKLPLNLIVKLFDICTSYTVPKHPSSKKCVQNTVIRAIDLIQNYQTLHIEDMEEGKSLNDFAQIASTILTDLKSTDGLKGIFMTIFITIYHHSIYCKE